MSDDDILLRKRLESVVGRIERAAVARGVRPSDITLIAVSKRQPVERVAAFLELTRELPFRVALGENYVQEWQDKCGRLPSISEVHLIGPLQTNKVKRAVEYFDLIESVHSLKVLQAISKAACALDKLVPVYLQVNVSNDPAKSGFLPEELPSAFRLADQLPGVRLRGLMTITALYEDADRVRGDFKRMSQIHDELKGSCGPLDLSMGMSADFDVAIEEGATVVRVGSAIFGERH